jgi:hypothetical protein
MTMLHAPAASGDSILTLDRQDCATARRIRKRKRTNAPTGHKWHGICFITSERTLLSE